MGSIKLVEGVNLPCCIKHNHHLPNFTERVIFIHILTIFDVLVRNPIRKVWIGRGFSEFTLDFRTKEL